MKGGVKGMLSLGLPPPLGERGGYLHNILKRMKSIRIFYRALKNSPYQDR
jgi:hypothetical protein